MGAHVPHVRLLFIGENMKHLIHLWLITIIVFIVTLALLLYGYIFNDSTIFFAGDLIGIPFSIFCYLTYKEEYNGYVSNARCFK